MSNEQATKTTVWAILVTSGTVVEMPVEVYMTEDQALAECKRWTSTLSDILHERVERPFDGRWEVGELDVRLVGCATDSFAPSEEWWVGTHWTADGAPEPEAILLPGRTAARDWVLVQPGDDRLMAFDDGEGIISATFGAGDYESFSMAHFAKVVGAGRPRPTDITYKVELMSTFVQLINGQVVGPPGLSRQAIEDLVERDWSEISAESHVLLESSWELETYRELR